ncbi:phage holin family protein [Niabella sp.]|uniref:phage holin family protein n=1 Tax=Niabella sp. TaxID=1962976 RepID=UPI002615E69B|nr:phage holin family protein [Niabella sp.]
MHTMIRYWPNIALLTGLLVVVLLDFIFGVAKATLTGIRRSSQGFRKTITKFLQYGGCIIVAMVILNIVYCSNQVFDHHFTGFFGDIMLYIMIYTEVVSVFENMEAMAPGSIFVKVFVRPVRRIITLRLKRLFGEEPLPAAPPGSNDP